MREKKLRSEQPELANKKGAKMNSVILTVCLADEKGCKQDWNIGWTTKRGPK